jgi:riboflavin biosynthesis pyrimidine reductase
MAFTVSANFAIAADGKISSDPHRPSGWTSAQDHQRLLELRRNADAIIVGRGTLCADNMSLTVPNQARQPLRCVVSRHGNFSGDEKVFHSHGGDIHLLVTDASSSDFTRDGVTLHFGNLTDFFHELHRDQGAQHIHCEGGGMLLRDLLDHDLLDTLHLTWAAHTLFGGTNAPTISGLADGKFSPSRHFSLVEMIESGADGEIFLTYQRNDLTK